jgi:hypothetical protein
VRPGLVLLLLLFGLPAAGCSDGGGEQAKAAHRTQTSTTLLERRAEDPPPSGRDLAWLGRLHRWETNLRQDGAKLETASRGVRRGASSAAQVRRLLRKLTRCEKNLLRQVREPHASRYRNGYELLSEGCRTMKELSLKLIQAIDGKSRVSLPVIRKESRESRRLFTRGNTTLESSLRANRPLRVARGSLDESKIEPRLSDATSRFVLHRASGIEVRCWSKREWKFVRKEWGAYVAVGDLLGFVHSLRPRTSIAPRICKQLAQLAYRGERPTVGLPLYRASEAVAVLAHESEHIRHIEGDEATTECHGMQRMRRLARLLGTSQSYADLLARTFWTALYRFDTPKYKSAECRDRGALDLQPASDVWP